MHSFNNFPLLCYPIVYLYVVKDMLKQTVFLSMKHSWKKNSTIMHLICFSMRPTIINWLNTLVHTLYISIDSTISVSDLETTSIEVDLTSQNVDSITSTTMHSTHGTVKHIWSTFIDNCYRTDTNGFKSSDACLSYFQGPSTIYDNGTSSSISTNSKIYFYVILHWRKQIFFKM